MIVNVMVKTGSKKGPLVVKEGDGLIVYLREKPHDNEANLALIRMMADYFCVSKSLVIIQRGQKSHKKVIEIPEK